MVFTSFLALGTFTASASAKAAAAAAAAARARRFLIRGCTILLYSTASAGLFRCF